MIKTDIISGNVLRITAPDKLKADDFRQIAPQVNSIISRYGKIRLLIDASGLRRSPSGDRERRCSRAR